LRTALTVVPAGPVETVAPPPPAEVVEVVPFDELEQPLPATISTPATATAENERNLVIVVHPPYLAFWWSQNG
jgi:hypothetical protein